MPTSRPHASALRGAAALCLLILGAGCGGDSPRTAPLSAPTPTPAPTPDPFVVEFRAFTDPILQEISARPPDYADDFSNPRSGWPIGPFRSNETGRATGETGYVDGEYYALDYGLGGEVNCGVGAVSNPMPRLANFVFKVDARFVQAVAGEGQQEWSVFFRTSEMGFYDVEVEFTRDILLRRHVGEAGTTLDSRTWPALRDIGEANTIELIVSGAKMAVLVNGEPALLGSDTTYTAGTFRLNNCNSFPPNPLEVRWDNVALWDLGD